MRYGYTILLTFLLLLTGCVSHEKAKQKEPEKPDFLRFSVNSYTQTMQILDNLGYTEEAFSNGMKEVPRVVITRISKRWQEQADKMPVKTKKSIFLRLMASGALIANDEIAKERKKLLTILKELSTGPISRRESEWLRGLAFKYKVLKKSDDLLTKDGLKELVKRVDIVPPTIVVAQGAVESGWGTSRFAVEGNALFGQWSFSDGAMKPKEQRRNLGNYGLATFKSPLDSIRSYMLNLNTHPAYREFRELRAQLRAHNEPLKGEYMLFTLERYSERGFEYIEELEKVIRANNLNWLDYAKPAENRTVVIDPDM